MTRREFGIEPLPKPMTPNSQLHHHFPSQNVRFEYKIKYICSKINIFGLSVLNRHVTPPFCVRSDYIHTYSGAFLQALGYNLLIIILFAVEFWISASNYNQLFSSIILPIWVLVRVPVMMITFFERLIVKVPSLNSATKTGVRQSDLTEK